MTSQSTTLEPLLNGRLAELLREQGLDAEAEQVLQDHEGHRHQVDVLVELEEHAVAIEAEFSPARTVEDDARKRLPRRPLLWRGLPVASAFTLVYPQELQRQAESRARKELGERRDLTFAQMLPGRRRHAAGSCSRRPNRPPSVVGATEGSVRTLAECLHSFWLRADSSNVVEQTIEEAAGAIHRAAECLRKVPDLNPHAAADTDAAATSALIWLNAMLFQELLAQNLDPAMLPSPHTHKRIPPPDAEGDPDRLREQWEAILQINWWPIFHYAREALRYTPVRPGGPRAGRAPTGSASHCTARRDPATRHRRTDVPPAAQDAKVPGDELHNDPCRRAAGEPGFRQRGRPLEGCGVERP